MIRQIHTLSRSTGTDVLFPMPVYTSAVPQQHLEASEISSNQQNYERIHLLQQQLRILNQQYEALMHYKAITTQRWTPSNLAAFSNL